MALPLQMKPALHEPDGAARPSSAQYDPLGQAEHAARLLSPGEAPNDPAGHGNSRPETALPVQTNPCGHCVGELVATPQVLPGGQGLHVDCPAAAWKDPTGQAVGEAVPSGQAWPSGHTDVAEESPPAQKNPAGHGLADTSVRANEEHTNPGVHGVH